MPEIPEKYVERYIFTKSVGLLWIKSMIKLIIVLLFTIQFLLFYPIAALIVLFIAYFSMPTSYETHRPFDAAEAWMRLGFGLLIAALLYIILSGQPAMTLISFPFLIPQLFISLFTMAGGVAGGAVSMFFLTVAFFCTLPERTEGEGTKVTLQIFGKESKIGAAATLGTRVAGNIFFVICVLLAGIPIITQWVSGAMQWIFILIWGMSLFMGWIGGREGRPYIGILVIVIAMFAFSYQFTGTVGTSVFGAWWPTVYHYGSLVAEPIGAAWSSAATSMQDLSLMMTCPSCYWAKQLQTQQVETGEVTSGGTMKSIELVEFQAINYAEGVQELNPAIPLIGSIQLENQGEFTASEISVVLKNLKVKNPEAVGAAYKSYTGNPLEDKCKFTSCSGNAEQIKDEQNNIKGCKWEKESYPGDVKLLMFKCAEGGWASGNSECKPETKPCFVNQCDYCCTPEGELIWKYPNEDPRGCEFPAAEEEGRYLTYSLGSWFVQIPFEYSFTYKPDVSLPVEVMNKSLFESKLINKEIRLEAKESQYTGGPVMASIWVQKQPLRDGDDSYGRISIINKGKGVVKTARLKLFVPNINTVTEESKVKLGDCDYRSVEGGYKVECPLDPEGLSEGKYATLMFSFNYDIPDDIESKSFIFTGNVEYQYVTTEDIELPIMKAPY